MRIEPLLTLIVTIVSSGASQMVVASDSDFDSSSALSRPAINPDFDPDYSCLFDVEQIQCVPGSQQECPRPQFGNNEDDRCFPVNDKGYHVCPDGYHGTDDDETGQCYPNENGCESKYDNFILLTDRPGKSDRCAELSEICDEVEHVREEYCIDYCREQPQSFGCLKRPSISTSN